MKNELTCAVVRDLLPSFVEGLTAPETNEAVLAHLTACPDCAALRAELSAPEAGEAEAPEVDYLKKVKRRTRRRVALAVLCTGRGGAGGLCRQGLCHRHPCPAGGADGHRRRDG